MEWIYVYPFEETPIKQILEQHGVYYVVKNSGCLIF